MMIRFLLGMKNLPANHGVEFGKLTDQEFNSQMHPIGGRYLVEALAGEGNHARNMKEVDAHHCSRGCSLNATKRVASNRKSTHHRFL